MNEVRRVLTQQALQDAISATFDMPEHQAGVMDAIDAVVGRQYHHHRFDHPLLPEARALQKIVSTLDEAGVALPRSFWCRESFQAWVQSSQVQRPSVRECEGYVRVLPEPTEGKQFVRDGKTTFVWAQPAFPDDQFSPTHSRTFESLRVTMQLFDPLLTMGAGDGPPGPAAALSYEVSDDGKMYSFHLNPNAKWSDGTAVVAQDFVRAFERVLNPKSGSWSTDRLYYLVNAEAYAKGDVQDFAQVGVRALDAHTLQVSLAHANDQFPYIVTDTVYSPIPPIAEQLPQQWTQPEHMLCSGPYRLTKRVHDQLIEMEKNPHHPDAEQVAFERVRIKVGGSEQAWHDWYELGEIDWTGGKLALDKVQSYMREQRADFHVAPMACTEYMVMNTQQAPFNDVRVRRAFNMAIDKRKLTKHVLGGGQRAVTHFVPDSFREGLGYRPSRGDSYDVQRARELLAEAGYPDGRGFPALEYEFDTRESNAAVATAIARQLKEQLNVEVKPRNMERKSLVSKLVARNVRFGRHRWCPDFYGPESFYKANTSGYVGNFSNYQSDAYDALIAQLHTAATQDARNAINVQLQQHHNRNVPNAPLFQLSATYLLREGVRGFESQYQDNHAVRYLWF